MITITFTGDNPDAVFAQIARFSEAVAAGAHDAAERIGDTIDSSGSLPSTFGYLPANAGRPTGRPVDDGTEWTEEVIVEWLRRLTPNGQVVVRRLAEASFLYSRDEIEHFGGTGMSYSGWWAGPRAWAENVRNIRGLRTWPYGHSDVGPRHYWMHPAVAARILAILKNGA